jgi:hypothetical protein
VNLALADGKENPNPRDEEQSPTDNEFKEDYSALLVLSTRGLVKENPDEGSRPA